MAEAWFTVVTREPEWDSESRARALRLSEYEASLCPNHHVPRSFCADKDVIGVIEEETDYSTRKLERHRANEKRKRDVPNPASGALPWDTGVEFRIRMHDPHRDPPIPETKPRRGRSPGDDQVDHGSP